MSYEFYKVLHLIGVFMVVMPLSGLALYVGTGGAKNQLKLKRPLAIFHGLGMLISIVAGFATIAKMNVASSFPTWVLIKLGIWLVLGVMIGLVYKMKKFALLFPLIFFFVSLAAYLAIVKPV